MTHRTATARQRKELSRLAERRGGSHAYPAIAWDDFDEAEKILNRTPAWRAYRLLFPVDGSTLAT